jgi:DNA-directed RNA polymerase subunit RPC12/RpoP
MKRKTSAVMVAKEQKLDRKKELSSYKCGDCGDHTVVQSSIESPFCVHCSSGNLTKSEVSSIKGKVLQATREEELAAVKCPNCSSHLIMAAETAGSHATDGMGTIGCPACATQVNYKYVEESNTDSEVQADEDEDTDESSEDDSWDNDDEMDDSEESNADSDEDNSDSDDSDDDSDEDNSDSDDDTDEDDSDNSEDDASADSDDNDDSDDDNSESDEDETEETEEEVEESNSVIGQGCPVRLPLHKLCAGQTPDFTGHRFGDANLVRAWLGDHCVAKKVCATEDNPEALAEAYKSACASGASFDELMASNGFETLEVEASMDTVVDNAVSERIAQLDGEATEARDSMGDIVEQSIGIAAMGLARGMFEDENPLLASLVKSMVENGLDEDNAETIASIVLSNSHDEYANVLRSTAMEIVAKPTEVRNELARTLGKIKTPKALASVNPKDSLTKELANPVRSTKRTTEKPSQTKGSRVRELASGSNLFSR